MDSTRSQRIKSFLFRNYFTMATVVFPVFVIYEKINTIFTVLTKEIFDC